MIKRFLYSFFVIAILATVGIISSAFTGTDNMTETNSKTTIETSAPVNGDWGAGRVGADGSKKGVAAGTTLQWEVVKGDKGQYLLTGIPENAIIVVTPIPEGSRFAPPLYHAEILDYNSGLGAYTVIIFDRNNYSVDSDFSFVAYAVQ